VRVPERDTRIAELEARLRSPRRAGVRFPVAVVCCLGALYLLYRELPDAAYALSAPTALTLGREGEYRFEALANNRYVQVHGTPTLSAFWGKDSQGPFLVLGLQDTPLLVRRAPLQASFAVRGRLLDEAHAPAYSEAFQRGRQLSGLLPRDGKLWIVLEGERPREDFGAVFTAVLLLLFAGLNGWLALKALGRRAEGALQRC